MKDGVPAAIPVTVRSGSPSAEIDKIVPYSSTAAKAKNFLYIQYLLRVFYIS
jgi:hypothetical protein